MPEPMLPGGPAPEMPQQAPQDPSQTPPTDPSQSAPQPDQGGDRIVSPEEKQQLLSMIDQIRGKLGSFHAMNFATNNKLEKMRSDVLKQVFEKLQIMGVDLTDKDSVAQFLSNLQQQSPELAQNFEKAMDFLLGGQGMSGAPQDPTQSMDLNVPPQQDQSQAPQAPQPQQDQPQG